MKHAKSVTDLVGSTPVLPYPLASVSSKLFLKMEKFNPTFSYKDRSALSMVEEAERTGKLLPGGTIIESSSGNTADSLAMVAAAKGYKFVVVVDDLCSPEKIAAIKAFGGIVHRVETKHGVPAIDHRREMARELARNTPRGYWTCQADNEANASGYSGLAAELLEQVPQMDTLIGAVGTGGSLCGTTRSLRRRDRKVCVIGVEPEGSTFFSDEGHRYRQSGSGLPEGGTPPKNFDRSLIDVPAQVSDAAAFTACNFLAKRLGLMVGGTAGGVVITALKHLSDNPGQTAVAILADAGEKYLDTIFNASWMKAHNLNDDDTWMYLTLRTRCGYTGMKLDLEVAATE